MNLFFRQGTHPVGKHRIVQITTYDHFTFDLARFGNPVELCSLRVGEHDFGWRCRFTVPVRKGGDGGRYQTVQVRFLHPLSSPDFAGWSARRLSIDALRGTYRAGRWQSLDISAPDLTRLPSPPRWFATDRDVADFEKPPDDDAGEQQYELRDDALVFAAYDGQVCVPWSEVVAIELTRYADAHSCSEIPLRRMSFQLMQGCEQQFAPPRSASDPFYASLQRRFGIELAQIEAVLQASRTCKRVLWTRLPMLKLDPAPILDGSQIADALAAWVDAGSAGLLQAGPLTIAELDLHRHDEPFANFPPRRASFRFSGINGLTDKAALVQVVKGMRVAEGVAPEIRPDSHMFMDWRNDRIHISLHFDVLGHGWLNLTDADYLARIRGRWPHWQECAPDVWLPLGFEVSSVDYDGVDTDSILPRVDPLDDMKQIVLWTAGDWQGFSSKVWSFRWRVGELSAIDTWESDICADRGGPYSHLALTLNAGARFDIRSREPVDVDIVRAFFRCGGHGVEAGGNHARGTIDRIA
ncbi:hypothetical protein NDR89_18060 [Cupriavidus gilardii]|uniref:Uncharacterized protein n=1 Tax=Cupriavidus gilardii TaxID=82541 RepID=A0ABY4VMU0_9BURK|nr:hypothetical protein [Cupriavidus gilardii]USE78571.1 hypothetical protein NDR89_18060 [Cupriavidus gilardii]